MADRPNNRGRKSRKKVSAAESPARRFAASALIR